MYNKARWQQLGTALAQAEAGDGNGIRAIVDGLFYGRLDDGSYDPALDRYFLLGAIEQRYPRAITPYLRDGKRSYQDYDYAFWNHGYTELVWGLFPIRARDSFDGPFRTTRRDPTTLVVGTRYDPATPYKESKRLVQQLGNAQLLTMTGDGHTAYGRGSECADAAIEAYLVDLTVPAAGTKCAQDLPPFPAVQALRAESARKVAVEPGRLPVSAR
jgi:pimeloyl-ACP methyl ester carboxylesterase